MIDFEDYKKHYPDTELDKEAYDRLFMIVKTEIKLSILGNFDNYMKDNEFSYMVLMQINHCEINGTYNDGITSQSVSGYSQTIDTDKKQGQFNWNATVWKFLQNYRVMRI